MSIPSGWIFHLPLEQPVSYAFILEGRLYCNCLVVIGTSSFKYFDYKAKVVFFSSKEDQLWNSKMEKIIAILLGKQKACFSLLQPNYVGY